MVTLENYEEYMMLYADGELTANEQQELLLFIRRHPHLQQELNAYMNTISTPDVAQVYAGKEELMKQPSKRIISLNQWVAYGAAAGILAIIFIGILQWQNHPNVVATSLTAVKEQKGHQRISDSVKPIMQQKTEITSAIKEKKLEPPVTKRSLKRSIVTPPPAIQANNTPADENQPIAKLNINTVNAMTTKMTTSAINVLPVQQIAPETALNEKQEQKNTHLLASLPIDENKKQALETLKSAVANKIEQVKSIKNNLKETDLVVKLGHKEIYLNL